MNKFTLSVIFAIWLCLAVRKGSACDDGWMGYGAECYKIFTEKMTFTAAKVKCLFEGGSLASLSSRPIFEFLTQHLFSEKVEHVWVGLLSGVDHHLAWLDGEAADDDPWVQDIHFEDHNHRDCFAFNGGKVKEYACYNRYGLICRKARPAFLNAPRTPCKDNYPHSFIGESSGKCLYPTFALFTKVQAESMCGASHFLDLDEMLRDGLTALYEHQVLSNNGWKYWTGLTWNGTNIVWRSGKVLDPNYPIPFYNGTGECVTVQFNFTDILETHLYQTECDDRAHGICAEGTVPTTTSAPPQPLEQQLMCPSGYNWKVDIATGFCYWETSYETSRLSWMEASRYCQSFGGDLASFHSQHEEKIGLSFQYGSLSHPYWIGLKLDEDTETYKWVDGSPLDYQNWAPGHPDHKDKRLKCVAMDAEAKHWKSSLCGILSWFICKAPKQANSSPPVVPTPTPMVSCSDDGTSSQLFYFEGFCYNVVDDKFSWHRAKQSCENRGSTLVSIHSDVEIGFLLKLLYNQTPIDGNRVWIGLNSLAPDGSFKWTDHSPVDFTYWNDNEPNNYQNQEKCCNMYIGNGLWNDENCNAQMSFICKRQNDTSVTTLPSTTIDPTIGNCKKGWFPYHDRCYYIEGERTKDRKNWSEASEICNLHGGYLVSIRNKREQAFLAYLMLNLKNDVWIGLHDTIQSGKYYWMDNSDLGYTNWAPGEPTFFGLKEDCVKLSYEGKEIGAWMDVECNEKHPFICQMRKDPTLPEPEYNRGMSCIHPEGWLKLDHMCFKMFAGNPMTWDEADGACRRNGGHLVSVADPHTHAVVTYLAREVNHTFWIGLRYKESTRKIYWLNDWPPTISRWAINEPGLMDENTCFASTVDGYWKRTSCKEEIPYVCQITTGKIPKSKTYTGDCPKTSNSWVQGDGSYCYNFDKQRRNDFYSATFQCYKYASELISLHSMDEAMSLKKVLPPNIHSFYIGLKRQSFEGFKWTDSSPVDFINWEEGQPENSVDNCVIMMANTLKWRVSSCFGKSYFVCSKPKDKEVEDSPDISMLVDSSTGNISAGTLAGIIVCLILAIVVVVAAVLYFRPLGKSALRNPFQQQSMSFENALYNVDSASMEFHEERRNSESL